jgi:hypothetical protein
MKTEVEALIFALICEKAIFENLTEGRAHPVRYMVCNKRQGREGEEGDNR